MRRHDGTPAADGTAGALEEYLAELEAGAAPSREEFLARHPELAEDLDACLAALRLIGRAAQGPLSAAGGEVLPPAGPDRGLVSGVLGDFRILREVGRGGMGVVYEAEQISLGRRVALKVLPFAATMDPRHLQRFHNEARAAASLDHPHIVHVHAVGSERAVHFYAMQFVEGQSLAEFLHDFRRQVGGAEAGPDDPTDAYRPAAAAPPAASTRDARLSGTRPDAARGVAYFRRAAEWGVQAAEALEYAHSMAVVHRDIKPANLMLDARGKLYVADFGLARLGSDPGLTASGDLLGTLRYMSPEQAMARHGLVDHRTDVYSLGATLYELLTLRPAVEGADRQELLRRIAFEEPTPPRRIDRGIPTELETVVLKALEKNPTERYATAKELAEDLRRFLADEPIRARRPSLGRRAAQWGRRHRAAVWAAAAVLLMGSAMLGGGVGWLASERAARRAKTAAVADAGLGEVDELQRMGRVPEALAAARRLAALLERDGVGGDQRRLLACRVADLELLDRLQEIRLDLLAANTGTDLTTQGAEARYGQLFREANLEVETSAEGEAAERLRRTTVAAELAAVLDHWALVRRGIKGKGDPGWKRMLRVARLADADAKRASLRAALETNDRPTLRAMAASPGAPDLPPATLDLLVWALWSNQEAAGAFLRAAQRRHPADFWLCLNLCAFYETRQPREAEEALHFAAVGVALRPGSPVTHLNLGNALRAKGRLEEAIAEYREAIRLKRDHPPAHYNLGLALYDKGRLDEAIAEYREAIRLDKDHAKAHYNLGTALRAKGRLDEAIAEYREVIRLKKDDPIPHNDFGVALYDQGRLDEAIAEYREAIRLDKGYANAHYNLGTALKAKGRLEEAIAEYREAIRLDKGHAKAHYNLGTALRAKGRLDEAIAQYREAIRLDKGHAKAHYNLGNALRAKGRLEEAVAEYREAIRLKRDHPPAHYNLGLALYDKGRLDEAIAEYREAIRLDKDYSEAHCNLGLALSDKGQFAEGLAELRRGHELGSRRPNWRYPSAQWVKQCERLVELDSELPLVLKGEAQPADAPERLALAELCQLPCRAHYVAAARFYGEAFAAQPRLAHDLQGQFRYSAACAAALAGCGRGRGADKLDEKEGARLRGQALDWLRADLKVWQKSLEQNLAKTGPAVAARMKHWLADPDFAGVRGPDALGRLPEGERPDWRELWHEVEALRQKALVAAKPPAAGGQRKPEKGPPGERSR